MELSQLISFDGLQCGNPVSVTKVPVHPINQITTGNSSQVDGSGMGEEGIVSNACSSFPVLWPKRVLSRDNKRPAPTYSFTAWPENLAVTLPKDVSVLVLLRSVVLLFFI